MTAAMIWPKPVPMGGRIGVLAPAWAVDFAKLGTGIKALEAAGFQLTLHPQTRLIEPNSLTGDMAGSAGARRDAFLQLIEDPTIDALLCARGGYGCSQWVDLLSEKDWETVRAAAKPLCGFSDATVLLAAQALHAGLIGWHGPMLGSLLAGGMAEWQAALSGAPFSLVWRTPNPEIQGDPPVEGRLVVGNLCLLQHLLATAHDPLDPASPEPVILALEEYEEAGYRIDRMLRHLHQSGRLTRVRAILLGELVDVQGKNWVAEAAALLRQLCPDILVLTGLPIGHGAINKPLPMGGWATVRPSPDTPDGWVLTAV
jgi:muramoyltetrapeptide carboxypeptidase